MKRLWERRTPVAAALLLALSVTTGGATVSAQEGSPSGQANSAAQTNDDNGFPWGLLGLLGLGGLAGLRRPEPVRDVPTRGDVPNTQR